jgi:hypothetical protein
MILRATKTKEMKMNTTQKIIALTRYLEKNQYSMNLKESFKIEQALRQLRAELSNEAAQDFESFIDEAA